MKTLDDIPILSGQTWDGHAGEFQKTRVGLFLRAKRELGDIGQLRFFGLPIVMTLAPPLIHEAFVEKHKSFQKSIAIRVMFYPFGGEGLFTSEGDHWRKQRKLLAPLFHPANIKSYAPTMSAVIDKCLDEWTDGSVVDITREMTRLTMAVAGKVMFDTDTRGDADAVSEAVQMLFEWLAKMSGSGTIVATSVLIGALMELRNLRGGLESARQKAIHALYQPFPFPTAFRRRFFKAIETLDDLIQRMIDARRRAGGEEKTDVLSRVLRARDEDDGTFMNDRQVRDEILTLFVAGHETTAITTSWSLYFLSRNPDVYRKWREEIDHLSGKTPTADEATKLEWTRGAFREAMRIYPPVMVIDRVAMEDVEVGGYLLPKKTAILAPVHALHRREDLYPDAERFDPTRFFPEAEAKRPRGSYLPFGSGPRVCIGAQFAELEAVLVLSRIAQRFDFEAVDETTIVPDYRTAMRPERPLLVRVKARKNASVSKQDTAHA